MTKNEATKILLIEAGVLIKEGSKLTFAGEGAICHHPGKIFALCAQIANRFWGADEKGAPRVPEIVVGQEVLAHATAEWYNRHLKKNFEEVKTVFTDKKTDFADFPVLLSGKRVLAVGFSVGTGGNSIQKTIEAVRDSVGEKGELVGLGVFCNQGVQPADLKIEKLFACVNI